MINVLTEHPTNDAELVSYVRPELAALAPELERVHDCYELMRTPGAQERYLTQEPGEPFEAYEARLGRSTYAPTFREAIRAFAGLLGNYQENELPKTLDDNLENVDMMGSSLSKFLNEVDQMVLRDGGAGVLVEMPPEGGDYQSSLEEIEANVRPYLMSVRRSDLINWRTEMIGGREVVRQAVIRTVMEVESEEGKFGTKLEPIYCFFYPGGYQKIRMERDNSSRWQMIVIAEGRTTLPVVPLVWYGATGSKFGGGSVPLAGLADLSIQHYQMRSDLTELIHKLSMPVPVRKGAQTDANGRPMALTIGPNTAIDLPIDGDFGFAEASGSSLKQHQEEINHVEALMDRSSLAFMYGSQTTKTATEAVLHGSQIQAQIKTLIENKESAVDLIVRLWAAYTNEKVSGDAGIEISDNLIQRPLEANEVQSYLSLFGENAISHQTLLEELQRGHALSQDIDIEEEMERVAEERKQAMEESLEMMQATADAEGPETYAPKPQATKKEPVKSEAKKDVDPKKEEEAKAGKKATADAKKKS